MAEREISDEIDVWLAALPPTLRERQSALAVIAILLVAFVVTAPFGDTPLPRFDAFIPTSEGITCVTNLITAVLLYALFSISRSRALLVLACGYLFTALIVIPHALTFPSAFTPSGLLGAGLQTTAWLYVFWHLGFPLAVCGYVLLRDVRSTKDATRNSTLSAIGWNVAVVIGLVCVLTWGTTAGDRFLPRLLLDRTAFSALSHYVLVLNVSINALAIVLLWARQRAVLDQWLLVALCAQMTELVLAGWFVSGRFTLAWYAGRLFNLVTSTAVLVVLLLETTRLYARLARSIVALQRERNNKLMNFEAMVASISHEVRQPLAAVATDGSAALRWLGHAPPDLEEVRSALNRMVAAVPTRYSTTFVPCSGAPIKDKRQSM